MKKVLDLLSRFLNRPTAVQPLPTDKPVVKSNNYQLIFACNQRDIDHLDSLVRYYETRYEGIISRGVWLLTLMRNSEIDSKRLAVVEIDEESGEVLNVSPIVLN